MEYSITKDKIIIKDVENFNIEHILDCGQVFRYLKSADCYTLFAQNKKCLLHNEKDYVIIESEDTDYFKHYFDLDRDYAQIKNTLKSNVYLEKALKNGGGIRILNQDIFEMVISFIISANNNIPRIKLIIGHLCEALGEYCDGFYAFPTLAAMESANINTFRNLGAGYRAEYLFDTCKTLKNDFDLDGLKNCDTESARSQLLKLKGVGRKVADCILLFGYHKTDLFPMDTWSKKIYEAMDLPKTENINVMSDNIVKVFGALSGYAQQYLYYYIRNNKTI